MTFDYDVIVVGGGPAGATAARVCSKGGLKTLVIEKERLPRYKACGGCLSIKTSRHLGFDLGPVIENTIYAAKFTYCLKDPFFITSQEPIGFLVMRDRFDQLLMRRAQDQGAELLEGTKVSGVRETAHGLEVEFGRAERLSCAYLIGADGPMSVVSRSIPQLRISHDQSGVGLESEVPLLAVRDFPEEDFRKIHLDFGRVPNGYGWVFPKRGTFSIGIGGIFKGRDGSKARQYFDTFVKELGIVDEKKMGRVVGHLLPCFADEKRTLSHGRVLLAGDAGHLMDPLTGEGIFYAIRSGELAAEAIVRSQLDGIEPALPYADLVRRVLVEDLKWARQVSQIIYRFTKLSYRTLKLYPELGQICLRVLEGGASYRSFVLSVKERMRGLVKIPSLKRGTSR